MCVFVEGAAEKRDKEIIFTPHFVRRTQGSQGSQFLPPPAVYPQGVGNILSFLMFALIFSVAF